MKVICSKLAGKDGNDSYLLYDTLAKSTEFYTYNEILKAVKEVYGVQKRDGKLFFSGYNYLPSYLDTECYVLVGKNDFLEESYYNLVSTKGEKIIKSESEALKINDEYNIINTVQNVNYIRLRQGNLALFNKSHKSLFENEESHSSGHWWIRVRK